jgi:uncharacterized repeat protein (TIGR02543 family)
MYTAEYDSITTIYLVNYVLNGGVNNCNNPAYYTVTSPLINLQNPTKNGYEFAGWAEGDSIAGGSSGNKTFTAQWTAIVYQINYVLNGGTNHADNPATYTIESAITLQNPTKTGYDFAGWAEGSTIAAGSTGNKVFTAQWTATVYQINYELNGGTNHADNPATYTIESALITLKNPTKEDYEFDGWAEGNTIAAGSTGNKTFTAQWKINIIDGIDNAKTSDLQIYPNPAKDNITINGVQQGETITITDLSGRVVVGANNYLPSQNGTITIDVSNLAAGAYLVNAGDKIGRFVK